MQTKWQTNFAEVSVEQTTLWNYYYCIPDHLKEKVKPGIRVRVPVGRGVKVGMCVGVWEKLLYEPKIPPKKLINVVDEEPLLPENLLKLARWMWKYYLCPPASVFISMLPSGVRRQTKTRHLTKFVHLTISKDKLETLLKSGTLNEKHYRILNFLSRTTPPVEIRELARKCGLSVSPIQTLAEKGYIKIISEKPAPDIIPLQEKIDQQKEITFTDEQKNAFDTIMRSVNAGKHEVILLFGVTGSGKTEIYIRAAEEVAKQGKQTIVLVPEIALTPLIISRFQRKIEKVCVLHSHMTTGDRRNEWERIRNGEAKVVIGTRSAIFAPTPSTGLIILDEEHENTYKQETTPRYHARDVAIKRGEIENAVVVLGSATPSTESYKHAMDGRYKMVCLTKRIDNLPMPKIQIVDLSQEVASPRAPSSRWAISRPLLEKMQEAIAKNEQVILFLNRKGFSSKIVCRRCGWVLKCKRCDSLMTFYKTDAIAQCHYCMDSTQAPQLCPRCGNYKIQFSGIGTEKIQQQIKKLFPSLNISRMDAQSMRTRQDYSLSLQSLWDGQTDVLVGTQMIAKGLDVPNVTLVGVILADVAFNIPDFRSTEKTFQLITQVAGRAGRGPKGGLVLVQTFNPDHYSIKLATNYDHQTFYQKELELRKELNYAPYSNLIRILLENKNQSLLEEHMKQIAEQIAPLVEQNICQMLGPAPLAKIKGNYRMHIIIKAIKLEEAQNFLRKILANPKRFSPSRVIIDVDPYTLI